MNELATRSSSRLRLTKHTSIKGIRHQAHGSRMRNGSLVHIRRRLHAGPSDPIGCSREGSWYGRWRRADLVRQGPGQRGRKSAALHVDRSSRLFTRMGTRATRHRQEPSRLARVVVSPCRSSFLPDKTRSTERPICPPYPPWKNSAIGRPSSRPSDPRGLKSGRIIKLRGTGIGSSWRSSSSSALGFGAANHSIRNRLIGMAVRTQD